MAKIGFRVEKSGTDWTGKKPRYVVVALGAEGYSIPGDSTYHIEPKMDSAGKFVAYMVQTTRGRQVGHTYRKVTNAINVAKRDARRVFAGSLSNPSALGWIPAKAVALERDLKGRLKKLHIKVAGVAAKAKLRNVAAGFYDEEGVFHPIRASHDYKPRRVGEKVKRKATPRKKTVRRKRR